MTTDIEYRTRPDGSDVRPPVPWQPLDALTRSVSVDMVRKAIGADFGAPTLKRAVLETARMLKHPADTIARAAALAIPSNGEMVPMPEAPDAWSARQHETRIVRNRKRVSTFTRDRVSMAPVIGDRYEPAGGYVWSLPAPSADELPMSVRQRLSGDLVALAPHRLYAGAVGLDVQRVTDRHLLPFDLPRLVGSDPTAWHFVGRIDRSDVVTSSSHRANMDGLRYRSALTDLIPFEGVYGTRTAQREVHAPRVAIRLELRKGERGNVVHPPRLRTTSDGAPTIGALLGYAACLVQVVELVAPYSTTRYIWRGHRLSARPGKSRDVRTARRGKRAAVKAQNEQRTIGEFQRPDTAPAWLELVESVGKGERIVVIGDQYRATITRQDRVNGRYSAVVRDHGARMRITGRTPNRVAHLLAV